MDAIYAALGRFVVRYRFAIIVAWIIIGAIFIHFFPSIASVTKDQTSGFLPSSTPSIQAQNLESRFVNTNLAAATLVASSAGGKLTNADQSAITRMETAIKGFARVVSVQDQGISPNSKARKAQILANVSPFGTGDAATLVHQIRDAFKSNGSPGLVYHLTGSMPINYDTAKSNESANTKAEILSYLVIIILLFLAFRSVLAPIVTLVVAGVALIVGQYLIAESTHIGVQVSNVTTGILIVLILGAGTDYSVFLLFRMREEIGEGFSPKDAVARALATVGESITFSGFTVIVALMSLILAEFGIYQSLGPPLAMGIALMLVAGLTLLPALLSVLGQWVFWPHRPKPAIEAKTGLWGRVAEQVVGRPRITLIVGLVLFGGLCLGIIGVQLGGFESSSNGPPGTDSATGQAVLSANFPDASANPEFMLYTFKHSVWSNMTPVFQAEKQLAASSGIRSVLGPITMGMTASQLTGLYRSLGPPQNLPPQESSKVKVPSGVYNAYRTMSEFITADGKTIQLLATPTNNNSSDTRALDAVPGLRTIVSNVGAKVGAVDNGMYGVLAFAYDIRSVSNHDLFRIVPLVALLIGILLGFVIRSVVAPLYLVASVILSYIATLGLLGIVFVHIGGSSGLNFVLPFVMFIFLMALGSDYNILVMARIREEAEHLPLIRAIHHAVGATGSTVTTAGIILGGTFASFGFAAPSGSAGDQARQIGYGVAAGVLLDTFFVRTLLVPSVVAILGRWNWWPSAMFKHEVTEEAAPTEPPREPVKA